MTNAFSFYRGGRACNGVNEALQRILILQVPTSTSARGLEEAKIRKLPRRLEERTVQALIHASDSPLSIVLVGVGNGPWDDLFMDFTEIMSRETSQGDKEGKFTLEALMKIPAQHDAIISQNI
ncbi:E3 ubiquitin-protein ligase RGLG1, partial [Zea mays]